MINLILILTIILPVKICFAKLNKILWFSDVHFDPYFGTPNACVMKRNTTFCLPVDLTM